MSSPITVAYGDGIGPEIMESVLFVLKEAKADISIETIEIGQKLYEKDWPSGIAPSAWGAINRTKVLLKAPTTTPQGKGHKSLNVALRKRLGLFANIRPTLAFHPLVKTNYPHLDIVVVRENEEDLYTGIEHRFSGNTYECTKVITQTACERICRYAFEYASLHNRRKVTCLIKDNIMKMTDGIFHKIFDKVAKNYPELHSDHYIVDIGMAKVATDPEKFDVIVAPNLYGDIVSDIIAQVAGSVGMCGSANIGEKYAMFEAIHGSAPDIAGKNIANPSGLLNAAIQMLTHLRDFTSAQAIYDAWLVTLEDGVHTADIYDDVVSSKLTSTHDFGVAVVNNLGKKPKVFKRLDLSIKSDINSSKINYISEYKERKLVGVDISLEWLPDNSELEKLLNHTKNIDSPFELVLIHSKGLALWPTIFENQATEDQVCCRFFLKDIKYNPNNTNIYHIMDYLSKNGFCVVKMENLYTYDGNPGFSIDE